MTDRLRCFSTAGLKALAFAGLVVSTLAAPAHAVPVSWTDWTATGPGTVQGNLLVGSTSVDVTYSGSYAFAQLGTGTNYWGVDAYSTNPFVDNPPTPSELIALNIAGSKTIAFSETVLNPIIALLSWNSQSVDFGTAIEILGTGTGHFGSGSILLNGTGTGFTSSGEVHGVIRLLGSFDTITFTDQFNENWHGITVGVEGLAVPAPGALAVLGLGLIGLAGLRRKG